MSKSVAVQNPAVVIRSQYRKLRSLFAVLLVAIVSLGTTVAVLTIDNDGTKNTTSSFSSTASKRPISRSYPTLNDPFQSQMETPRPLGGPDESAVASTLSKARPHALGSMTAYEQIQAFIKGH
jgi:hypothetical protein